MEKVELFENERAANYDQFVETWIPNYHYFLDSLPKLLRGVTRHDLLIVGCGTGNELERFVGESKDWKIMGVDPSPQMIDQAKKKFNDYPNVEFFQGLLGDLIPQRKYAAATLLLVLHFLKDNGEKQTLLKQIAQRLESGAFFVILDITGDKHQILSNLAVLKMLLPDDLDGDQVDLRMKRIEKELHAIPEERLSELVMESGFERPIRFFQSSIYMGWLTKKK